MPHQRWAMALFAAVFVGARLGVAHLMPQTWLLGALVVAAIPTVWAKTRPGRVTAIVLSMAMLSAASAAYQRVEYDRWSATFQRAERGVLTGRIVDVAPHTDGRVALMISVAHEGGSRIWLPGANVRLIAETEELVAMLRSYPPDPLGYVKWPARLYPFTAAGNPGEFDPRLWAMQRGIVATAYLDQTESRGGAAALAEALPSGCTYGELVRHLHLPSRARQWLRHLAARWRCRLTAGVDGRAGAIAVAMILGQKDLIDPELRDAFSRAGVSHLLAVSGLHVGFLLILAAPLIRRSPPALAWMLTSLLVIGFVGLVYGPLSALRAGSMTVIGVTAKWVGREIDRWQLVGLAGAGLLLWQPLSAFDLGLQLSFLSVIGLLGASVLTGGRRLRRERRPFRRSLTIAFAGSLGAQALTWPLVATAFSTFSWVSPVVNLVAVPLAGIGVGTLIVGMIAWEFTPVLGDPLIQAGQLIVVRLVEIAEGFAAFGAVEVAMPSAWAVAGWGALLYGIYALARGALRPVPARSITRGKRAVLAGLLGLMVAPATALTYDLLGVVDVWVLDVGQGDSVLIRGPWNRSVLVDGGGAPGAAVRGGFDVGRQVVVPALKRLGVRRLEAVINTHPHDDHVHGLVAVIHEREVRSVYASAARSQATAYRQFLAAAEAHGLEVKPFQEGSTLSLGKDSWVQALATGRVEEWRVVGLSRPPGLNDASVALLLRHRGGELLLLGDMEIAGQHRLQLSAEQRGIPLAASALLVPHHGARSSFSPRLIDRVSPRVAVISVGHNAYGHPAPEVLQYLEEEGVAVRRTDREGAVRLRFWPWGLSVWSLRG